MEILCDVYAVVLWVLIFFFYGAYFSEDKFGKGYGVHMPLGAAIAVTFAIIVLTAPIYYIFTC